MKKIFKIYNLLILIGLSLTISCSKYYYKTITELEKQDFQESELTPEFDFFELRIDILRQVTTSVSSDNISTSEDVPYHPVIFNLGNGLIMDYNNNFCLSVTELLQIGKNENFTIVKQDFESGRILSRYNFEDNKYKVETNGFFLNSENTENIYISDSLIIAEKGLFSKYTVTIKEDEFTCKSGLSNIQIKKQAKGWYSKYLFGQQDFFIIDNQIYLGNFYSVSNSGNELKILSGNNPDSRNAYYTISKTDTEIYIYNQNFNGYKIYLEENKITVEYNGKKLYSYYIEY